MRIIDSPGAGLKGEGSVRVVNDTQVGVSIKDKEGKLHQLSLEYPQGVRLVKIGNWQLQSVNDVFIQLTPDSLDIRYIRPRNGTFYTEFSRFGAEEGELPTMRYAEAGKPFAAAKWENPERYYCFPLYEVFAAGEYTGMEILDILTYEFEWDENLDDWAIVGSPRKKWHTHFLTFLNVLGFDAQHDSFVYEGATFDAGGPTTIAYVLPELEELLVQRKKIAQVTVKDGWVQQDQLIPGPFGMTRALLESAAALALEAQADQTEAPGIGGVVEAATAAVFGEELTDTEREADAQADAARAEAPKGFDDSNPVNRS